MADRLVEIIERWEKATPGPWRAEDHYVEGWRVVQQLDGGKVAGVAYVDSVWNQRANAEAIAQAPVDIGYLLDELRQYVLADKDKGASS